MKVLVYGNSGSGKSTYARALAAQHRLAHLDLDSIVWEPGKIAVPREPQAVLASLAAFISTHQKWVIEGCYGELVEAASTHCTQLVFLNPGLETCQANNLRRPWEPHKYSSMEQQNSMLANLQLWVADYYSRDDSWSYKVHRKIFDAHPGSKVEHTVVPLAKAQPSDSSQNLYARCKMKYWEIIADNLSKAGWSWACVSAIDSNERMI